LPSDIFTQSDGSPNLSAIEQIAALQPEAVAGLSPENIELLSGYDLPEEILNTLPESNSDIASGQSEASGWGDGSEFDEESPLADLEMGGVENEAPDSTDIFADSQEQEGDQASNEQLGVDQNSASQDAAIDSAIQAIDQNIVSAAEEADDAVSPESGEETSTDTQDDGTQDI
jgi:hypothetical protein